MFMVGSGDLTVGSIAGTSSRGELHFEGDVTLQDIWMRRLGTDLSVTVMGTSDRATFKDFFNGAPGAQIGEIKDSTGAMIDSGVGNLVAAMAKYASADPTFDPSMSTTLPSDSALQSAVSSTWHH